MDSSIIHISLRELKDAYIKEYGKKQGKARLSAFLSKFNCELNPDIDDFLKNKALSSDSQNESRTFLFIKNEEEEDKIVAHYTVLTKPILLKKEKKDNIGGKLKRAIKGMFLNIEDQEYQLISTYLIAQIGRDDNFTSAHIDVEEIFAYIFEDINKVVDILGGNIILIEVEIEKNGEKLSKSTQKLINLYKANNFTPLTIYGDDKLTQLMKLAT